MGVTVETITPGDGTTYAKKGQTVVVHYTGTLTNGKKFDSSRDKGRPFQTKIGIGQVIKGWDEGFTKISLGERAKLTITPDYGYGAAGAGGVLYHQMQHSSLMWSCSRLGKTAVIPNCSIHEREEPE